ncbi:MAG TPA: hypothetical protein VFI45_02655 [Candidatus Acidoferrum sp.]|nr:hypothetical protein [Candidatus Acidoferrum sp.]
MRLDWRVLRLLVLLTTLVLLDATWSAAGQLRTFTIKDSIELSHIIDSEVSTAVEIRGPYPPGDVLESPNHSKLLILTERGVLATNCLEATIWTFDRKAVAEYVSGLSNERPLAKKVVVFSSQSNTPVISDVRWFPDSHRVSFLGKNQSTYQQLFVADINTGEVKQITKNRGYVSAYSISGNTIAYTTLDTEAPSSPSLDLEVDPVSGDEVVDVHGQNLFLLLYPKRQQIEDVDEAELLRYPNKLHLIRNGRELDVDFKFDRSPLRVVLPVLSVSPDGKSLITLAFTPEVPTDWSQYEMAFDLPTKFNLNPEHQRELEQFDAHRASQYVLVNLDAGTTTPLVDAPAARCLYWYFSPNEALWSKNGRSAVLSNTFLPVEASLDEAERNRRYRLPVIANIDLATRQLQRIVTLERPPRGAKQEDFRITHLDWNDSAGDLRLTYGGRKEEGQGPRIVDYKVDLAAQSAALADSQPEQPALICSVEEELDQPPVLSCKDTRTQHSAVIFDPNPQLSNIKLGTVKVHKWTDNNGHQWHGLLALPPDYDPSRRYPLLIQTYGYEPHRFFTDGQHTSGYAGRAASGNGIVVLQMEDDASVGMTPEEGPANMRGFESAIVELSNSGLIDPSRVGVLGFSRTCTYVLYALTHRPELFAAGSIFDGMSWSYVQDVLSSFGAGVQEQTDAVNGGPPFGPILKTWLERAPGFNLDKVVAPLRMYEFERTGLAFDWEIYSGLYRLKKPVDFLWLRKENATHILIRPRQRYLAQQGAVDWFSFWLLDKEDPDPAKAKQYIRWRELRGLRDAQIHSRRQ